MTQMCWPRGEKSLENHKCSFCSDSARSTMATSEQNKPPVQPGMTLPNSSSVTLPYPLPSGIFKNGTLFNSLASTKKVAQLYEQIIINKKSGDSVMQDEAFATLLMWCTVTLKDGTVVFKMVECETPKSTLDGLITQIDGLNYLHLDCLQDFVATWFECEQFGLEPPQLCILITLTTASCYVFILVLDRVADDSYIQPSCNYIHYLPAEWMALYCPWTLGIK